MIFLLFQLEFSFQKSRSGGGAADVDLSPPHANINNCDWTADAWLQASNQPDGHMALL
jgi:hypothetical protein